MTKRKSYAEIIELHPEFKGVIPERSWDFIGHSDKATVDLLKKPWIDNIERNIKSKRYKRHGGLHRDCIGMGKNKALIGIGAGQSFNKNKGVLKVIHDIDGVKPFEQRDFIFVASNHMFKPLLNMGIIPDFVMVADASDVVLDQLTKDIPESGRNCVLITGLHCSPKVIKKWEKQGRDIRFYLTTSAGVSEKFEELTGEDMNKILIQQGGNVLNSCWTMGLKFFKSSVFMALGNDLSYPLVDNVELRRRAYYADGDYSTNAHATGTGRDEAKRKEFWYGFRLEKLNIVSPDSAEMYDIKLDEVGTTGTLWVYKTWIEANVLANSNSRKLNYTYYNCTEGGIAGVMCKDDTVDGRKDIGNWFLIDDVCKRWRTRTLSDAVGEFLKAKEKLKWGIHYDAPGAMGLGIKN